MQQHAKWLNRKLQGIKGFCGVMVILGFPLFNYLAKLKLAPDFFMIMLFLVYVIAWSIAIFYLQIRLKPLFLNTKRDQYIKANPDLSEEFRQAIRQGLTLDGMNAEMCSVSTGFVYKESADSDGTLHVRLHDEPKKRGII
ncbi:MAG: hypothetical protein JEZ04_22375 [Spirochaetales bacterium]|nr:hypothetical protein [Spirochaetales bacterium]